MPMTPPLAARVRAVPLGLGAELHGLPLQPVAEQGDPEQITAERDACQWFNAQYDTLNSQSWGFQNFLRDQGDNWSAPGVLAAANLVRANMDQSAAFLDPRVHTLYITNYPDRSEYSPLYNGDSFYHLWFQFTQISDKIARQVPAGRSMPTTPP